MLLGAAIMRPFMRDRADDARLAVFPVDGLDAGHVAQPRLDAVGGDQQRCLQGHAVGEVDGRCARLDRERFDGHALDDVDAEFGRAAAQRAVERPVHHHMRERLAGRDLAVEGEEDRAHRIRIARIGDDHLGDRLRMRRDLGPAAELLEHAASGGGDRRGAAVALPGAGGRRVDDGDFEVGAGGADRHGDGETDIAGAGDQHVEPASLGQLGFSGRFGRRHHLCLSSLRLDFGRCSVRNRTADHTAIGDGHVASHARASRHTRPRAARTQSVSWSQPQGRLAARLRRPGDRPGAGRRAAHGRAGAACAFAALLLHAAGRHDGADHLRGRTHPRRRLLHDAARDGDPAWPCDLLARSVVPGRRGRSRPPVPDAARRAVRPTR